MVKVLAVTIKKVYLYVSMELLIFLLINLLLWLQLTN
nr:MAG TPA: hypothetical protein [Herelleviridae sp.]